MLRSYEERLNDQWKQTREIVYMIYCSVSEAKGRESIFEFMPLPGDPTPEEIKQMKMQMMRKKMESNAARVQRLIEKGMIKKPFKKNN
jgi:hypothetical protein